MAFSRRRTRTSMRTNKELYFRDGMLGVGFSVDLCDVIVMNYADSL